VTSPAANRERRTAGRRQGGQDRVRQDGGDRIRASERNDGNPKYRLCRRSRAAEGAPGFVRKVRESERANVRPLCTPEPYATDMYSDTCNLAVSRGLRRLFGDRYPLPLPAERAVALALSLIRRDSNGDKGRVGQPRVGRPGGFDLRGSRLFPANGKIGASPEPSDGGGAGSAASDSSRTSAGFRQGGESAVVANTDRWRNF